MSRRRSIRNRRRHIRLGEQMELQLTSMMDMLVIILVFLLKSYVGASNTFTTVPGIQIPISAAADMPPESLQVIVTPEGVTFENNRILDFVQSASSAGSADAKYQFKTEDLDEGGRRIVSLYQELVKAREKSELLRLKSAARDEKGQPLPFEGVLAIQADKRVNYETVRRIMYTAAAAGYRVFRFLALKKDV